MHFEIKKVIPICFATFILEKGVRGGMGGGGGGVDEPVSFLGLVCIPLF